MHPGVNLIVDSERGADMGSTLHKAISNY